MTAEDRRNADEEKSEGVPPGRRRRPRRVRALGFLIAVCIAAVGIAVYSLVGSPSGDVDESSPPEGGQRHDATGTTEELWANAVGAKADLSPFECSAADGTWAAAGTLTNPESHAVEYFVRVAVTKKQTGTVVASREEKILVEANGTHDFVFNDLYANGKRNHACVSRVLRSDS